MADTCPDCGRPQTASYREWREHTVSLCGVPTRADQAEVGCLELTRDRLRARVAELEQAHAEQVAELELRLSAWEKIESWRESNPDSHDAEIVVATDSEGMRFTGKDAPINALAWCEAERARQAKDDKWE